MVSHKQALDRQHSGLRFDPPGSSHLRCTTFRHLSPALAFLHGAGGMGSRGCDYLLGMRLIRVRFMLHSLRLACEWLHTCDVWVRPLRVTTVSLQRFHFLRIYLEFIILQPLTVASDVILTLYLYSTFLYPFPRYTVPPFGCVVSSACWMCVVRVGTPGTHLCFSVEESMAVE